MTRINYNTMSSVSSSKKLVDAIVKVVRNNNKLIFYNANNEEVPKKIIKLDMLKSVELFTTYEGCSQVVQSYRARFYYIGEDETNSEHIDFTCGSVRHAYNPVKGSYETITHNWEKETVEVIKEMNRLL